MSKPGERNQGKPGGPIPRGMGKSMSPPARYEVPSKDLKLRNYVVTGITKDSTGAALGNVTVDIYETLFEIFRGSTISDAVTGIFIIHVNSPDTGKTFYARANLAGAPERSGTTVEVITVTEL